MVGKYVSAALFGIGFVTIMAGISGALIIVYRLPILAILPAIGINLMIAAVVLRIAFYYTKSSRG
ncbi:MAG: hypothetical protein M1548_05180 [Actinobacteria bacterium]|nr:hypothetical protein [Actinomycetota bacterium]